MRLIDADALIRDLSKEWNVLDELEFANKAMWKVIENAPTIEERKIGRWIDERCSECGQYVYKGDARNFCPNCGAYMRGDEESHALQNNSLP